MPCRLSEKIIKNIETIMGLRKHFPAANEAGHGSEITAILATISNALKNPDTTVEIFEAVASDDIVNHLMDLIGLEIAEIKLCPADKPALLSEAIETPMAPVKAVGSVN